MAAPPTALPVPFVLQFRDQASYNAALATLRGLGVTIRSVTPEFLTLAVTAPPGVASAVLGLAGLASAVRDVPIRPAVLMGGFSAFEAGISVSPQAQSPAAYDWQFFTVSEVDAIDQMNPPVGLSGEGVRVAVLDTGIDTEHPVLQGQVEKTVIIPSGAGPGDGVGHGTWVAGAIAGKAAESPRGPWHGLAPGARIVNVKVLDDQGNGMLSDVVSGLAAALREKVDLVNMSLGTPIDFGADPLANAVQHLTNAGVLCVCAAGNDGPPPFTMNTPGSAPASVTVAAATTPIVNYVAGGRTADFSSRGPAVRGITAPTTTQAIKPDVAAPGGGGHGYYGGTQVPELIYGPSAGILDIAIDGLADGWGELRGTSMATPNVAGILALLLEKYRFTRYQLEQALSATAKRHSAYKDLDQGWGFLDGAALAGYLEVNRLYR